MIPIFWPLVSLIALSDADNDCDNGGIVMKEICCDALMIDDTNFTRVRIWLWHWQIEALYMPGETLFVYYKLVDTGVFLITKMKKAWHMQGYF